MLGSNDIFRPNHLAGAQQADWGMVNPTALADHPKVNLQINLIMARLK
jgi:hypothetical protein